MAVDTQNTPAEDPGPPFDEGPLGQGFEPIELEAVADIDPDTSPDAFEALLAAEDETATLENAPLPDVAWAADNAHPDFAHLATAEGAGLAIPSTFAFDIRVFDLLAWANHFQPRGKSRLVAFGLRGGTLVGDDSQENVAAIRIEDTRPDHGTFRCTLGLLDLGARTLSAYRGSTVPNRHYMRNYYKIKNNLPASSKTRCNLLPTGCYIYRVNAHGRGRVKPALRMTNPANLTEDATCTVLRTHRDLRFDHSDLWDPCTPYDNIHCAYYNDRFSSAGCQTIKGPDGGGAWGKFQDRIGALGWNARIDYLLITAREAAIANSIIAAGRDVDQPLVRRCLERLRVGSEGDTVAALQKKLGFKGSGYFGPLTKKRLTEYEKAAGRPTDGIYCPEDDAAAGWGVFPETGNSAIG